MPKTTKTSTVVAAFPARLLPDCGLPASEVTMKKIGRGHRAIITGKANIRRALKGAKTKQMRDLLTAALA